MMHKLVFAAFILLAMLLPVLAENATGTGFEDLSLSVTITVNPDGTAHVDEDVQLAVAPAVSDLYKQSLRSTRLTIDDWKRTTGSKNLRYHVLGANVTPLNTRVFPQPLQRLQFVDTAIAIITIEYDTSAPIFSLNETGPRRTTYKLIGDALSFENAPEGQVLPEYTVLNIVILRNSRLDLAKTYPRPTSPSPKEGVSTATHYVWNATGGAIPITPFDFTFETEKSLDEEVGAYFADLQANVTHLVFSNYGMLIVILAAILVTLYVALRQSKVI